MDSRSHASTQHVLPARHRPDGTWRFTVPPVDGSVPWVRHAVRDLLRRRRAPVGDDLMFAVELVLSELVTNGVRHAALLTPQIGVEVTLLDGWLRLGVEDGHPYRPRALEAVPDQHETGGRGLLLVKAVALEAGGDCGVTPTAGGGKVIWATFPLY
ncbi:ATP-binding protein [Streptomyces lonarensis]|uniref:ATP-binding protein n=1 Tax=Streptomyces lonarensis TaxID=700599 RepID=A0A7X6HZP5_9ACTN|nr:ATP-binding protein [Streptomyces lonarensis]NJQ06868.1 ATP-binding protein [Streptomyces lonarensis]